MTIMIVASELSLGCKLARRFLFDVDDGKDFCYRSRVSFSAFFHGTKQRNMRGGAWPNFDVLYHQQDLDCFQAHLKIFEKSLGKPLPEGYDTLIELPNLWEFYKAIGWDYKTKKWSK